MSLHNIIGSERSGEHVVIRYVAARRALGSGFWTRTVIQAVVCALPVIFLIALFG